MTFWLVLAGYLLMVFASTRVMSAHYWDSTLAHKAASGHSRRDRCVICNEHTKAGAVGGMFLVSLVWPVALPLFLLVKAPTRGERVARLEREAKDREAEITRLQAIIDH